MKTPIITIGNAKGIRLPKEVLEKYNIQDSVELVLEKEYILLKPIKEVRKGWAEAFKLMHEHGDDTLLLDDVFEDESFENSN